MKHFDELSEGSEHYRKGGIQPVEYIQLNNLDFFEGNVIKYITRHKEKNGAADLVKARNYINMMLDMYSANIYKGVDNED